MLNTLRKLRLRYWQRRLFPDATERKRYRDILNVKQPAAPEQLSIRELGGERVWCRPGTTDPQVLLYVFERKYHLPPKPLRPDCVILDLGANVGYSTLHFARLYPKGRVIGVELDDANAEMARRNTAGAPNAKIVRAAVWTHDGEIRYGGEQAEAFRVGGENGTASRTAPAKTIATLMAEEGIDRVDYVKMDIEGAEVEVLKADPGWLSRVSSMKVEWHPPATEEMMMQFLKPLGFSTSRDPLHWACVDAIRA